MQPVLVELVLVLQKVAGDNVTVEIRNILKEVDRNGDGRIDYEEFCDMMRQVKQVARESQQVEFHCSMQQKYTDLLAW